MIINHVPVLFVVIPMLVAFVLPIIGLISRTVRTWVVVLTLVFLSALSLQISYDNCIHPTVMYYMVGSSNPTQIVEKGLSFPIRIGLKIDSFSLLFLVMTTTLSLLFFVFSIQYIREDGRKNYFIVLFMTIVTGMMGLIVANDLFTFFVFLEILSISSAALVAFRTERKHPPYASFKYMFISAVATSFFLLGIAFLYAQYGSFNIDYLARLMRGSFLDTVAIVLLIVPLVMKSGVVPIHMWIPDAYSEAPAPISAMLKLGSLVCLYGLFRLSAVFGISKASVNCHLGILFIVLGIISMFVGVTQALIQKDVKRLMAFHAISQVGYMLLAFGVGLAVVQSENMYNSFGKIAIIGGLFHLVNNGLYKGLLLLLSGIIVRYFKTRDLNFMHGLAHHDTFTTIAFIIGMCAISGIPPFNGFVSKLIIYESVFKYNPALTLVAMFVSILTLASFMKVLYSAFLGIPAEVAVSTQPLLIKASIGVLCTLIVCVGMYPESIIRLYIEPAVNILFHR